MFDQSFSDKHLAEIYAIEKRKGNIPIFFLGDAYHAIVDTLKGLERELHDLEKKKKDDWTDDDKTLHEQLNSCINEKRKERKVVEDRWLDDMSARISNPNFRFSIVRKSESKKKDLFVLPKNDPTQFMAMKCLQHNLANLFKVKQANRHLILSQLRLLLQENTPKYIMRTDIKDFYESIPQYAVLKKLDNNTLLSFKSKRLIKGILEEYEKQKEIPSGRGIPRGIGISAYLAEIYMREIDDNIRHRPEVLFYVRYVDDIFIILSSLPGNKPLNDYYSELRGFVASYDLSLYDISVNKKEKKVQLLDLHDFSPRPQSVVTREQPWELETGSLHMNIK